MSTYENVVLGKLKLKGKALHVKGGGIKKKVKHKKHYYQLSQGIGDGLSKDANKVPLMDDTNKDGGREEAGVYDDYLTPAERRYLQQWDLLDRKRLAKMAGKSHRDRIQEFNQYLADLSEHYDIPKVGPG